MGLAVWMILLQGPWELTSWCTMATAAWVWQAGTHLDPGRAGGEAGLHVSLHHSAFLLCLWA